MVHHVWKGIGWHSDVETFFDGVMELPLEKCISIDMKKSLKLVPTHSDFSSTLLFLIMQQ